VILKEFISSQQVDDKFGEVEGLIVYQYVPLSKQEKKVIKSHKRISAHSIKLSTNQEYVDVVSNQRKFESDTKISLEITARTKGIRLVYDFKNGQDYSSVDLPINVPLKNSYLFAKGNSTKLYFWNPDKLEGLIEISEQIEEELIHPLFKKL
jgi:hypothetical protein